MASNDQAHMTYKPMFEQKVFSWSIPDFDMVRRSDANILDQKVKFTVGDAIGLQSEWQCYLTVNEKGMDMNRQNPWIGVSLGLTKCSAEIQTPLRISLFIKVKQHSGNDAYKGRSNFICDMTKSVVFERNQMIEKDTSLANLPLIDGCLVMEVELTLHALGSRKPAVIVDPKGYYGVAESYKQLFVQNLISDMAKALHSPSSKSDAETKIVTSDGKEFSVNRGIVSARCAMLEETMIQSEISDSQPGIVRVTDISSVTMKIVLHFLYTGTLLDDWCMEHVIVELVLAAGKFKLQDLLQFLDETLGTVTWKTNVGKVANLARKFSLKQAEYELLENMKSYSSTLEEMIEFARDLD